MFPERRPREVSKLVNEMVAEGLLEYWSTGSTTMIGLKGAGIQHEAEDSESIGIGRRNDCRPSKDSFLRFARKFRKDLLDRGRGGLPSP